MVANSVGLKVDLAKVVQCWFDTFLANRIKLLYTDQPKNGLLSTQTDTQEGYLATLPATEKNCTFCNTPLPLFTSTVGPCSTKEHWEQTN